jgi:fermentation-respiration switch protein FrsA (DUF1100 family)
VELRELRRGALRELVLEPVEAPADGIVVLGTVRGRVGAELFDEGVASGLIVPHARKVHRRPARRSSLEQDPPAGLLFDHRGFGASGGEPRLQINTWIQARGYLDAIAFARGRADVEAERIALWGDSLSGGVAIVVAAVEPRIAALAVQVPSITSSLPPADPDGALFRALRDTVLTGAVEPSGAEEMDGPMPVVTDDPIRNRSALRPLTAYRWFIEYGGRFGSGWVNDVTRARPKTPVPWHPGLAAPHVSCPALFLVSPHDEMPASVSTVARDAFDRLRGPKQWVDVEGGHFGLLYYPSAEFEHASAAQVRFLEERLVRR